ncbi:MAG: hypothetical protein AAGC60_04175 [Acidobacteriota bacterium]
MSVQELNRVHRRYIRLSNHFKSAWTFHQFLQGLRKVFPDLASLSPQQPADFQTVYGDLKQVSQNLAETTIDTVTEQLDAVERRLAPLVESLLAIDDGVSPALLRQFFQRVKNYDDNILSQLVKLYLYSHDSTWNLQRLDKSDYLVTKLAEEYHEGQDAYILRDQTTVRELGQGLWAALAIDAPPETELEPRREQIAVLRNEIDMVDTLDRLHTDQIVPRYRDLKHALGSLYFEPHMLREILTTNLALKNHVHRLYRRDEQRIVAEYQQIFELERDVPVDVQLGEELGAFREAVERFEEQLKGDEIKLEDLALLRGKVRSLMPKLQPDTGPHSPMVKPAELREEHEDAEVSFHGGASEEIEYVAPQVDEIVAALDNTNPTVDPRKVALQPEVFSLGVGKREIIAYRRLFGDGECDRELESFVLRASGLRVRIEREVEEIKGLLDESAVNREAPIFHTARTTCAHADLAWRRFEHWTERAVLVADGGEARELQRLKMIFLRAYCGLWLMVYR